MALSDSPLSLTSDVSTTPNSQKFGRYYTLNAETGLDTVVTIAYPFTCQFSIKRNNLASVNTATFTIYNLNESTRLSLFKDPYDVNTFRLIEFFAGYQNQDTNIVPLIFKGNIKQCYSEREGSDFKTVIECYDGQQAMGSSFVSQTLPSGIELRDQYAALISQMKNITGGTIGTVEDAQNKRGVVQFGNPADIMKQLTNIDFYVDRLVCYVLDNNDVILGELPIISSKSGILDVPKRTETSLTMSILFEPRLQVSQLVKVDIKPTLNTSNISFNQAVRAAVNSNVQATSIYNGEYKLTGISHDGIISGAVNGDCRTTINLLSLGGALPVYKVIPDDNEFSGARIVQVPTSV